MKYTLFALLFLVATMGSLTVAAQQPQMSDSLQELVDSSSAVGVDAFSDTTAVDTGTQQTTTTTTTSSYHLSIDDIDDLDDVFHAFSWGTGMMLFLTMLALLLPFLLFIVPVLLIAFVLFLIFRRNNRQYQTNDGTQSVANDTQTQDHMPTNKKLYRSNNRILGGVCAGVAEYLDIDPTVVRIIYFLLTFFTAFSGVIVYLILWLLIPARQ